MANVVVCSSPVTVAQTPDLSSASNKEFLDIMETIVAIHSESVRGMITTYSQMHGTDKSPQHNSII